MFVNTITQKVMGGFLCNLGVSKLWTREKMIKFLKVRARIRAKVMDSPVVDCCEM